jgi:hypothetical protein
MTTIRSPGWIVSFPRGRISRSPRMMPATLESAGRSASRKGRPTILRRRAAVLPAALSAASVTDTPAGSWSCGEGAGSTSSSTICTWPSAKTSVIFAAGTPMLREIACAVSSSEETMWSKSSTRSRQTSRYSTLLVRTIVLALGQMFRASKPEMMLISSREVHAMKRSAPRVSCSTSVVRLAPSPSTTRMSNRYERASRRLRSRSMTVSSCSSSLASDSTIVEPTCPAPMMKMRMLARAG